MKYCACLTLESIPDLLPIQILLILLLLTSSFAAAIITTGTRGHLFTANVHSGCNNFLSVSIYMVVPLMRIGSALGFTWYMNSSLQAESPVFDQSIHPGLLPRHTFVTFSITAPVFDLAHQPSMAEICTSIATVLPAGRWVFKWSSVSALV